MPSTARKIIAAATMLLTASAALPQGAYALDAKDKKELGEFIREYLVANPEILLEAQQSRLSFHLQTLKDAGLVSDRRAGRWIHYSLVPEAVEEIRIALEELEAAAKSCAASCCRT